MTYQDLSNNYLNSYKRNEFSQGGEDGILEKIFSILPESDNWCVEFGAWDGMLNSNTYYLTSKKNWNAILIEGDSKREKELEKTFERFSNVKCVNKFVNFSGSDTLDNILSTTNIPTNFDLLSIDIDGNDYHIWKSLEVYHPKVLVIEFNPAMDNTIDFIQEANLTVNHGCSLLAMIKLGKEKGYELISTTGWNAFFVQKELFPLFNIKDNSIDQLRTDLSLVTKIYQLLDGTIKIEGNNRLIWHGLKIKSEKLQLLPKFLRVYPSDSNKWYYKLGHRWYRFWNKR
jgi:hypothetical protein